MRDAAPRIPHPASRNGWHMSQVELTRQRLVRAALELFTAQGYHVTTTPLIAKKAGVAEGTIYRHFASKQHLLNELYRAAARWGLRLVKEADGFNVGPRAKLAELGRSLVAGAGREPAAARLFLIQRHGDLLDDDSRKLARDFSLDLEALVAQAKAEGSVKPGAAEIWAAVWLSVVTLAIDRVSARDWPQTHAAVQLSLDAAWDAIAAAPATTPGGQADGGSGGQRAAVPVRRTARPTDRFSSNSAISGGVNTRIGTPTTPMPRLTYSWLPPR